MFFNIIIYYHKANEEALKQCIRTVIKHSGHLRTLENCSKNSPAFWISNSLVFSNARRVLSLYNTRLRLLYLVNKHCNDRVITCNPVYDENNSLPTAVQTTDYMFNLVFPFQLYRELTVNRLTWSLFRLSGLNGVNVVYSLQSVLRIHFLISLLPDIFLWPIYWETDV